MMMSKNMYGSVGSPVADKCKKKYSELKINCALELASSVSNLKF